MWFVFALICLLGWGLADLFYKKSSDEDDRYSHLKIAVWVGLVMGVCAFVVIPFTETGFSFSSFWKNMVAYLPASLSYIVSMVIGYAGMRYLEISIISPVQNSSGALSAIAMIIWFAISGKITDIRESYSVLDFVAVGLVVAGVVAIAIVEKKLAGSKSTEKKYRFGALALIFPLLYCVFDTIGTAADGIILDEETGLGLGEFDVIVLYGITFLLAGIVAYIFLWIKEKKPYNPFKKKEITTKGAAACFEEFGQIFYVFAMAENPVLAAPIVASYCIVSVILSRIFLREKLKLSQYICIGVVIAGIVIMGISEGMSEM